MPKKLILPDGESLFTTSIIPKNKNILDIPNSVDQIFNLPTSSSSNLQPNPLVEGFKRQYGLSSPIQPVDGQLTGDLVLQNICRLRTVPGSDGLPLQQYEAEILTTSAYRGAEVVMSTGDIATASVVGAFVVMTAAVVYNPGATGAIVTEVSARVLTFILEFFKKR